MTATRKIVRIDEAKCNGCGQCVTACAEGALRIIDGKARLVSETYCDGLGACLGKCPQDAITVEERPAAEFDAAAVEAAARDAAKRRQGDSAESSAEAAMASAKAEAAMSPTRRRAAALQSGSAAQERVERLHGHQCPGTALRSFAAAAASAPASASDHIPPSQLGHWPVQLMLVPPAAPFLKGADLLVCADCVAFALPGFHERYLGGRAVLVGCPKLDDLAFYQAKLKDIFAAARPTRVTVLRMEVPCCAALAHAVLAARDEVLPDLPVEVHTIGIRGTLRKEYVPGTAEPRRQE